jgi:hypothetical protein
MGGCLAVLSLVGALAAPGSVAQQASSASATPVTQSSGRPSTIAIKEDFLRQRQAILERDIEEARRCIESASNPQTLRDPEGNINRVPQTDLVNCTRRLVQLQRQLDSLAREAKQLAQDAQAQATAIQRKLQQTKTRQILQGGSDQ